MHTTDSIRNWFLLQQWWFRLSIKKNFLYICRSSRQLKWDVTEGLEKQSEQTAFRNGLPAAMWPEDLSKSFPALSCRTLSHFFPRHYFSSLCLPTSSATVTSGHSILLYINMYYSFQLKPILFHLPDFILKAAVVLLLWVESNLNSLACQPA